MTIAGVCHIIACILHNIELNSVLFDHNPPACIDHVAWKTEGLPVLPVELAVQGWEKSLDYLRKTKANVQFAASTTAASEAKAFSEAKARAPRTFELLQRLNMHEHIPRFV